MEIIRYILIDIFEMIYVSVENRFGRFPAFIFGFSFSVIFLFLIIISLKLILS